ncbi:MAG: hypothetical protein V4726_22490 [Verrucomicrobiota bacterium]
MKKIGLVFNGVWSHYAMATAPKYRDFYELVYIHDLTFGALRHLGALVIPFQSHQAELARRKEHLYQFLAEGGKIAVFGDSTPLWLEAQWEDRPVDNFWWVTDPSKPPVSHTDHHHPVYAGLAPRHACWHIHGVYTRIPAEAEIIQKNGDGEVITWQTRQYGGVLFGSTLDPVVEHGVQQIRHLDHYVDSLTAWLCGVRPEGAFSLDPAVYGVDRMDCMDDGGGVKKEEPCPKTAAS